MIEGVNTVQHAVTIVCSYVKATVKLCLIGGGEIEREMRTSSSQCLFLVRSSVYARAFRD